MSEIFCPSPTIRLPETEVLVCEPLVSRISPFPSVFYEQRTVKKSKRLDRLCHCKFTHELFLVIPNLDLAVQTTSDKESYAVCKIGASDLSCMFIVALQIEVLSDLDVKNLQST